jgi:hypothetical protein
MKTYYIDEWRRSMAHTYENIKYDLIKNNNNISNPAVYSIETELTFPIEETLLPIAKRRLVKYISAAA